MINDMPIPRPNLIPSEWTEMANRFLGFVAGGAVRDTFLGYPVKDVDIFTWNKVYQRDIESILPGVEVKVKSDGWRYDRPYLKRVFEFEWEGVTYDLMVLRQNEIGTTAQLMDNFYAHICEMYADPRGRINLTQHAVKDIEARTITIRYEHRGVHEYFEEKLAKYIDDGWNMVPEENLILGDIDDIPF